MINKENPNQPEVSSLMSETAALNNILTWSEERPAWQRDALRRLIVNGTLTEEDLDELLAICANETEEFTPLSAEHIAPDSLPGKPIKLLGVANPVSVNALASDQSLEFAEDGLTIVYGDNGSGKSGYVRVLKHACRSRDRKVKILTEVGELAPAQQSAKIRFKRGDVEDAMDWSPVVDRHPELPSVSIFDSKSASTHVEETNNVAYTPFPMQVLERLSTVCDSLRGRIRDQVSALEAQTPQAIISPSLSPDTPAGSFLSGLSAKSNKGTLKLLTTLSQEEEAQHKALESDLAQDSKQAVARLSSLKSRLSDHNTMLVELSDAASEAASKRILLLRENRDTTAKLAKAASEELFAASPLPDIGGALWRSLWEAAREYSNEVAYKGSTFPETKIDEDLCVLCQQPLDEDAVKRRLTFEEFIKGTTKADEISAKTAYENAVEEKKSALPSVKSLKSALRLVRSELEEIELSRTIRISAFNSVRRINAMVDGEDMPSEPSSISTDKLEIKMSEITKRINALSAGDASPERLKLVADHRALKDRLLLKELEADIEAEIDRRIEIAALNKSAKTASKVSVTNKNKELSDKLVTDVLRDRFAREVQKLKIGTLPIELRKEKDSNAQSFFRVAFVAQPKEPLGDILSEGEHRCVALAAFLAELVTSREYSGIVFDDPMSSLDHLYRRNVAVRLVEEADHRQVIIFTHDLSFLFEVKREAEGKGVPVHFQTFYRKKDKPGHIQADLPMKAKNAGAMAAALQSKLKQTKGNFDDWSEIDRTIFSKGCIEQLREAWDQAIADFIFPVLGRFDSKIKTGSIYRLSILTDDDVKKVVSARGRLSEDLHATSETLNPEAVAHDELSKEVKTLIEWLTDINARQSAATKPSFSYAD